LGVSLKPRYSLRPLNFLRNWSYVNAHKTMLCSSEPKCSLKSLKSLTSHCQKRILRMHAPIYLSSKTHSQEYARRIPAHCSPANYSKGHTPLWRKGCRPMLQYLIILCLILHQVTLRIRHFSLSTWIFPFEKSY